MGAVFKQLYVRQALQSADRPGHHLQGDLERHRRARLRPGPAGQRRPTSSRDGQKTNPYPFDLDEGQAAAHRPRLEARSRRRPGVRGSPAPGRPQCGEGVDRRARSSHDQMLTSPARRDRQHDAASCSSSLSKIGIELSRSTRAAEHRAGRTARRASRTEPTARGSSRTSAPRAAGTSRPTRPATAVRHRRRSTSAATPTPRPTS